MIHYGGIYNEEKWSWFVLSDKEQVIYVNFWLFAFSISKDKKDKQQCVIHIWIIWQEWFVFSSFCWSVFIKNLYTFVIRSYVIFKTITKVELPTVKILTRNKYGYIKISDACSRYLHEYPFALLFVIFGIDP
jgi:hypothetical protein